MKEYESRNGSQIMITVNMHTGKDIIYQDEMKKNRKENSIENNKYQRPARSNWYFGDSGRKNPSLTNSLSTPEAQMM